MSSKTNDTYGDASMGSGETRRKKMRPHWYKIEYTECVLCGSGDTIRERVYGKKPKNYTPSFRQYACCEHFF